MPKTSASRLNPIIFGKKSFIWYWIGRIEEVASLDKTLALPLINFLWNHTTPWLNCVLPPSRKGKNLRKIKIRVFDWEILGLTKHITRIYSNRMQPFINQYISTYTTPILLLWPHRMIDSDDVPLFWVVR